MCVCTERVSNNNYAIVYTIMYFTSKFSYKHTTRTAYTRLRTYNVNQYKKFNIQIKKDINFHTLLTSEFFDLLEADFEIVLYI